MSHIVYTYVLGMGNVTLLLEKCECLSGNATEYATPTVKFHRLDTLQKGCKRDNSYVFFFLKLISQINASRNTSFVVNVYIQLFIL